MKIESLLMKDLAALRDLQPQGWDDITIPHKWYLESTYCTPLKLVNKGKIAGIGTVIFHQDTAWLAHIIVHADYRNKGLGQTITQALVEHVDRRKYETIYLIATDLGLPVYSKVGFITECEYALFTPGTTPLTSAISPLIVPFEDKYLDTVLMLDHSIAGEDRSRKLIEHVSGANIFVDKGEVQGVFFTSLANGLIIADNAIAGIGLMKLRLQTKNYAIFPAENKAAFNFLSENNFNLVKVSRRMYLGKKREWQPAGIYNRVSGQIG